MISSLTPYLTTAAVGAVSYLYMKKISFIDILNAPIFCFQSVLQNSFQGSTREKIFRGALKTNNLCLAHFYCLLSNVNSSLSTKVKPLQLAIQNRRVDIATHLIEQGADINEQYEDGSTPLLLATQNCRRLVPKILQNYHQDPYKNWNGKKSPIEEILAADYDKRALKKLLTIGKNKIPSLHLAKCTLGPLLIAHAKKHLSAEEFTKWINQENKDHNTPLHTIVGIAWCANAAHKYLRLLINSGANLEARNSTGKTPLLIAAKNGDSRSLLFLMEKGADLAAKDFEGNTIFHYLVNFPRKEELELTSTLLLEKGALINACNNDGKPPLLIALKQNTKSFWVKYLLKKGADPFLIDDDGQSILYHLIPYPDLVEFFFKIIHNRVFSLHALRARSLGQVPSTHASLLWDRVLNTQASNGLSPLSKAVFFSVIKNNPAIPALLLQNGAALTIDLASLNTQLDISIHKGHLPTLKVFEKHTGYVNQQIWNGSAWVTPLRLAIEQKKVESIRFLIKVGAKPTDEDRALLLEKGLNSSLLCKS